jgi:hypothetical protein
MCQEKALKTSLRFYYNVLLKNILPHFDLQASEKERIIRQLQLYIINFILRSFFKKRREHRQNRIE